MRLLVALAALPLVAACKPPSAEMTETEIAQIQAEVTEVILDYQAAWAAEDIESYLSFLSDWAGSPYSATATLEDFRRGLLGYFSTWDWEIKDLTVTEVLVLGRDAAAAKGTMVAIETDTTDVKRELNQQWADLWIRVDGRWQKYIGRVSGQRRVVD